MLSFHSLTIEFEVRTEADSGLLFYMARINHADFATVQLRNGLPYFSYDLGSGDTITMIPNKINDGQWHKVIIVRGRLAVSSEGEAGGSRWHSPGTGTVLPVQILPLHVAEVKNKARGTDKCPALGNVIGPGGVYVRSLTRFIMGPQDATMAVQPWFPNICPQTRARQLKTFLLLSVRNVGRWSMFNPKAVGIQRKGVVFILRLYFLPFKVRKWPFMT